MALKCECGKDFKIKQGEVNAKKTLVIECKECNRYYYIDLVCINNFEEFKKHLDKYTVVKK